MKSYISFIIALATITSLACAETHVPAGPVSGTWTLAGSPYYIEGNILIGWQSSLIIQPGVQVIMNPNCSFSIFGQLQAVGTQPDSIRFLAADTSIGSEGLHFLNTNTSTQDSSRLEYCVISYGVATAPPDPYMHGGGLYILNSSRLCISHCFIQHCRTVNVVGTNGGDGGPGGEAGGPGGNAQTGNGGAVYVEACSPLFSFCSFAYNYTGTAHGGNGGHGGWDFTSGQVPAYGGPGGGGGFGHSGNGGAICLKNSSALLYGNILHHNYTGQGFGGNGGAGGDAYSEYYAEAGNGGPGGIGTAGNGGAVFCDSNQVIIKDNIMYHNILGNGVGGNGGGAGGGMSGGELIVGDGGPGGNGYGGLGYATRAQGIGTVSMVNCTVTNQSQLSIGQGGSGGQPGDPNGQGFNGFGVLSGTTIVFSNGIVWNNIDPNINPQLTVTYSCIQTGHIGQGNISTDPLFVTGPGGAYYLSQIASGQTVNSPCLDAGNPASPMLTGTTRTDQVQDAGIVDMGYHYPLGLNLPQLDVTLTPLNPPIVVPANGGSFQFNAMVQRTQGPQAGFYVWTRDRRPDTSYTPYQMGPVFINPPVGVSVNRLRTQTVPSGWLPGLHWYLGYANATVGYPAAAADSFSWTKSTTGDGGATIWEASCTGEPFPGEELSLQAPPLKRGAGGDLVASPNPFNSSTAISYQLSANSHVSLKVYDTAGRLTATLVDGWREAGTHEVTFDGSKLASGLYFVSMQAGEFTDVQKIILLK